LSIYYDASIRNSKACYRKTLQQKGEKSNALNFAQLGHAVDAVSTKVLKVFDDTHKEYMQIKIQI
jgi:hypothetical protein